MTLVALFALAVPAAANPPNPWPEVLTLDEAARFLRVHPTELGQLADWGQVPARRIGGYWRFNRVALLEWLKGDTVTYAAIPMPGYVAPAPSTMVPYGQRVIGTQTGWPLPPVTMARIGARGTTGGQPGGAPPAKPAKPIGEAPEGETAEDVFLRGQRVLLGTGEVTLELGLFYSRSDNQAFRTVSGGTVLGTIENDTFTTSLTGRYGLDPDTELFAGGSFRRQSTQTFSGSEEIDSSATPEFGDVSLGVRETVLRERSGVPDVILTVTGRIPTEDSSFAVGGGVAVVKSVDPVVLFANANYRHVFARDFSDTTRLEARDRIDATAGFAFALNDTLTLSSSLTGVFTGETAFSNATLRQRESFSLQFGLTSLLTKNLYIEPTVSFGLNGPGSSFAIGVSLPYTFEP